MKNVIVKDGYEMKLEYVSITVFENNAPVYTTPQVLDSPFNRAQIDKFIEPFLLENKIQKRFIILESKKTEVIKFTHR